MWRSSCCVSRLTAQSVGMCILHVIKWFLNCGASFTLERRCTWSTSECENSGEWVRPWDSQGLPSPTVKTCLGTTEGPPFVLCTEHDQTGNWMLLQCWQWDGTPSTPESIRLVLEMQDRGICEVYATVPSIYFPFAVGWGLERIAKRPPLFPAPLQASVA